MEDTMGVPVAVDESVASTIRHAIRMRAIREALWNMPLQDVDLYALAEEIGDELRLAGWLSQ